LASAALYVKKRGALPISGVPILKFDRNNPSSLIKIATVNAGSNEKVVIIPIGGKLCAVATHPDIARDILKNDEAFPKGQIFDTVFTSLVKQSILRVNGEKWRHQRAALAPGFQFDFLKGLVPMFISKADSLIQRFPKAEEFEVSPYLFHWTVDVLAKAAFGMDFSELGDSNEYYKHYLFLSNYQRTVFQKPITYFVEYLPFLPYTRKLKLAQKKMREMTKEILEISQKRNGDKRFLIDMMTDAHSTLSDSEIDDNTFIFFVAGHETTASALNWALYLLARHPDKQAKIQEEVDRLLGGKHVEPTQLKDLVYLDMFVKEVLRYGSPISLSVSRRAESDIYLDKYLIPKGTPTGFGIHAIHHNPDIWPDPEVFDPERFNPGKIGKQHPFAFLPFSLGKRVCIGNNFSLMEQKVFLSMLLQKYTVTKGARDEPFAYDPQALASTPNAVKVILVQREKFM